MDIYLEVIYIGKQCRTMASYNSANKSNENNRNLLKTFTCMLIKSIVNTVDSNYASANTIPYGTFPSKNH